MSTPPPPPNNKPPSSAPNSDNDNEKARNRAAAERYAEVALKSRPLPEGFDPNQRATIGQAVSTIKPEDFLRVHETPCARQGILSFIMGGAGVGGLKYVLGGKKENTKECIQVDGS